ncbi:SUKH-4 family immunity protein [Streptomyces sp. ID05-26A]|nr:SUKH-4 family immunity protein [Streptomyces sp. ID05-26A]
MATDLEIGNAVAGLDVERVPFEGKWHTAPYPEREVAGRTCAILADDPGVQQLVVSRDKGEVWFAADRDDTELVNQSLDQFAASARIYLEAKEQAESTDQDNDKALEKIGNRARKAIRKVDRKAVRDENQFWSVATEELGYGM